MQNTESTKQHIISESIKPVIYELGAAIYMSQLFENNIVLLNSLLKSNTGIVSKHSFLNNLNKNMKVTLGKQLNVFNENASLSETYKKYLRQGVKARNYISHNYILNNTDKFQTPIGRNEMINELREIQYLLKEMTDEIAHILDAVLKQFGGSMKQLKEQSESAFDSTATDLGV